MLPVILDELLAPQLACEASILRGVFSKITGTHHLAATAPLPKLAFYSFQLLQDLTSAMTNSNLLFPVFGLIPSVTDPYMTLSLHQAGFATLHHVLTQSQ